MRSAAPRTAIGLLLLAAAAAVWAAPQVRLRFLVWDGDQGLRTLRPAIAAFERRYPNIKVKLETATQSYQEKLLAQVAASCAPDVAMMDPSNFQRFARRDALLPLNQFFDQIPGFDIQSYYKPLVAAHSYRGQLYVLPRDIAPCGIIFYNKQKFREAGIPYPDGTWTWDFAPRPELRQKCFTWVMQQLTKRDASGRVVQWGYAPAWATLTSDMFAECLGARLADDYESPRQILYDDPRFIKAYQLVADISLKHGWMPTQTEMTNQLQTTAVQLFSGGKAAMYQSGIWDVPNIRSAVQPGMPGFFDWDIALAPGYRDPATGQVRRSCPTGGSGYCILRSTRHPREAWLLTAWMAGPPGMESMAKAGYAQPGIRALAIRSPWIPGPDAPEEQRYPPSRIVTDEAVPYVHFGPTADYWPEVMGYVSAEIERIFNGTASAQQALTYGTRRAQARLDTILKERGSLRPFNWVVGGAVALALLGVAAGWVFWPERKRRLTRRQKVENRAGYAFILPWVLGLLAFTVGPMLLSLLMSFADWDIIRPANWRGLQNYAEAFTLDPRFWKSLQVTTVYSIFAVPLGLAGSLALALLLNVKVRGMPLFRTCFYLPSLTSMVVASLIWRRIFQPQGGLLNAVIYGADGRGNFLGLATVLGNATQPGRPVNWLGDERTALAAMIVMSLWGIGGGMIILLAGLQGIPQHYYEAATVDGAGPWTRFRHVTLPLLTPSIFFSLVTGVIGAFQVFTQSYVMTGGGPNNATRFYMLHLYENAFLSLRMGYASAMAWVLFAIVLVLTLVQFRFSRWVYYEGGSR